MPALPQKRMLTLLKIRNLALVDELVWELGPGLVGVTGETGAGKSVIVGALKLVLGERADKSLIRTGEDGCTVEAVFELEDPGEVDAVLAEGGLEACDGGLLIVRRVIGQSANRQFVNDSPVTLGLLKRIGEHLVDLHGPHDHQSLLSTERQLSMLDAYAALDLEPFRVAWRAWRERQSELEELREAESASGQELELLRHQLDEIDAALQGTIDRGRVGQVGHAHVDSPERLLAEEQRANAVVHVVGHDDRAPARHRSQHRSGRGRPGGERRAGARTGLKRGEGRFERGARRVLGPGVHPARVRRAVRVADEGRGGMNRRCDRAGRIVDAGTRMHGERLEAQTGRGHVVPGVVPHAVGSGPRSSKRTGTPAAARSRLTSPTVVSERWKMPAARAASASPISSTSRM